MALNLDLDVVLPSLPDPGAFNAGGTRDIAERPRGPGGVAAFMPSHSKTPYITPSMDFYSRNGVVWGRRGPQLEFSLGYDTSPTQNTEYRIQNTEYRIQNTEYRIQNTEYRIQNTDGLTPLCLQAGLHQIAVHPTPTTSMTTSTQHFTNPQPRKTAIRTGNPKPRKTDVPLASLPQCHHS